MNKNWNRLIDFVADYVKQSMSSDMAQVTCLKTNMIWNNKKILKGYFIVMLIYCKKKDELATSP